MPANRTAALGAALTAAVTAFVTLLGAIPSSTGKAIVVSVALVVGGAVAIVFLLGWQKHEERVGTGHARTSAVGHGGTGSAGATVTTSTGPKSGGGASAVSQIHSGSRTGFVR